MGLSNGSRITEFRRGSIPQTADNISQGSIGKQGPILSLKYSQNDINNEQTLSQVNLIIHGCMSQQTLSQVNLIIHGCMSQHTKSKFQFYVPFNSQGHIGTGT